MCLQDDCIFFVCIYKIKRKFNDLKYNNFLQDQAIQILHFSLNRYNQYNNMAFNVFCTPCGAQLYHISHPSYHYKTANSNICTDCHNNGKGKAFVKNLYQLPEKEDITRLEQQIEKLNEGNHKFEETIQKYKQHNFFDLSEDGEVCGLFLTKSSAEYMERHQKFLNNLQMQQSGLQAFVKKSVSRLQKKVEKEMLGIIANEAKALSEEIKEEGGKNDLRVKKAEEYRNQKTSQMAKLTIYSELTDTSISQQGDINSEGEIDISCFIFAKEEVKQFLAICQVNIEKARARAGVLSKLVKEGQNIAGELCREKVDFLDSSKTNISTISKIVGSSKGESMILEKEQEN